jgi:putative ABC transport system permease protein
LRAQPGTARFVAEAQVQAVVPGIAEPIPYYAYRGDASWTGYALIAGRWFAGPHEVVAPTKLLAETHLRVGDTFTAHIQGRPVRLLLVGEIFDQQDDDLLLRGGWSTVAPGLQPDQYEVQLKAGTSPDAYARAIRSNGTVSLDAQAVENSSTDTSFILLNGVIGGLALILTAIAVAGVFNTVLLTTREKVRDVAILKAIGMAPQQVVAMVVASVAFLGLVAGAFGIPAGLLLHRAILQTMGQVATGTNIPASFLDPIGHAALPLLALTGVAVAALGAWIPARWAAAGRVAEVLQAE